MEVVITDMDYEDMYYESKARKILILGSGGQVGAYLTDYLRRMGNQVLEFDITNGSEQDMTIIPNGETRSQNIHGRFCCTSLPLMWEDHTILKSINILLSSLIITLDSWQMPLVL